MGHFYSDHVSLSRGYDLAGINSEICPSVKLTPRFFVAVLPDSRQAFVRFVGELSDLVITRLNRGELSDLIDAAQVCLLLGSFRLCGLFALLLVLHRARKDAADCKGGGTRDGNERGY